MKRLIARPVEKWKKMERGERIKIYILCYALILACYSMVYVATTHKPYFEAKKLLHRKLNRIETRSKGINLDTGINANTAARKIKETEKKIAEISGGVNSLDGSFAPLDSPDVQQQLLLKLSTLAERTGVELLSVSRKGFQAENGEEIIAPLDRELGRPLLIVTANTEFMPLLDFLEGLKKFPFYVSVMNLKVYSRHLNDSRIRRSTYLPPGAMYARLEMSI
ncbi:MAG: hypothetical protein CSA21_07035 [Deltaproteobacteria bacterium]|nr:MAG: hypothetical protein CSA21_07035 [Deltaproteobacteria bacterium]